MNIKSLLQEQQLKVTPTRLAVLSFLMNSNHPLAVDEIFNHVLDEHNEADKVTIYRILDTLSQKGIIMKFEFGEGKYRYELAGDDHHHFICESCGEIEDISDCGINEWEKEISKKKKFSIKRHSLEFYGVCQLCQS